MACYVVTYDLNKEMSDEDRKKLRDKIKSWGKWAQLSESCYAIDTTRTADDVYEAVKPYLDSNDSLYVIPIHQRYMGYGNKDVIEWLDNHLTQYE